MNTKKIALFVLLAIGIAWAIWIPFVMMGLLPLTIGAALGMFAPAVSALIVQAYYKAPFSELGWQFRPNKTWLLPLLFIAAFVLLTLLFSLAMPNSELKTHGEPLIALLKQAVVQADPAQLPQIEQQLTEIQSLINRTGAAFPFLLFFGMIALSSVAGATINALFAFGEELGWRGFLYRELGPLGFWRSSLVIGTIWGLWHAPIIAMGYNYPQHPIIGIGMMTLFTILLSPLHAFMRERGQSVWAAAILHGTLNASGAIPTFYFIGGTDLTMGILGVAGFLALVVINGIIWKLRPNPIN